MIIQAINKGLIFHFQNTDSNNHIDFMVKTYDLVYMPQGFYVPEVLKPLLFGYYSSKTNNNEKYQVNFYNYLYNNMFRFKVYYNYKKATLVNIGSDNIIENCLDDGLYYTTYAPTGQLTGIKRFEGLNNDDIKLLAQPLHAELLNTIEVLLDTNDDLKLQNERIIENNKALVDEINTIKEAINNIATSIKTIPAAVGSPLNPALITNLIVNPTDTFENQANIYEDLIGNTQNQVRNKNIIKLMETTAEIKEK